MHLLCVPNSKNIGAHKEDCKNPNCNFSTHVVIDQYDARYLWGDDERHQEKGRDRIGDGTLASAKIANFDIAKGELVEVQPVWLICS